MKSTDKFQIVRAGSDTWNIHLYSDIDGVYESELVGRVTKCTDQLYHIQYPIWQTKGYDWGEPQDRGYSIPDGALKAFIDRFKNMS